jgi:hypothetical protein
MLDTRLEADWGLSVRVSPFGSFNQKTLFIRHKASKYETGHAFDVGTTGHHQPSYGEIS